MQVVCYFGKAARQGKAALPTDSLLAASEEFARRNQLTGLLAVSDGYFLHVLEGDETAVQNLVGRIAAFWDQESPTILFERSIAQRSYQQWNVVISHGSKHRADAAQRLADTQRFLDDDDGDAADPFRYFLTPNRASKPVTHHQPVRQVAIFSNSVLWFNPIFSHLSERFGTQACALKVSNTGKDADSYPLDYADVVGEPAGPVRIVGISDGLLASTLSQPLLEKIELMVFLMRRSGQGTDTEFVARALSHPAVQRCKPRVLFVTPGGNTALSELLHDMVSAAGLESMETRGSVLMGGPTWKAIHQQLMSMTPTRISRRFAEQETVPATLSELREFMAEPEPQATTSAVVDIALEPPLLPVETAPVSEAEVSGDTPAPALPDHAATDASSADLNGAALKDMLDRLMHGVGTTAWAGWVNTRQRVFAARTDNAPNDIVLDQLAQIVADDFARYSHTGPLREMVSTFSEHHEIMVPHPLDASLVLYLFARLDDLPLATLRRLILDDLLD